MYGFIDLIVVQLYVVYIVCRTHCCVGLMHILCEYLHIFTAQRFLASAQCSICIC